MTNNLVAMSQAPSWAAQTTEDADDLDEPPEPQLQNQKHTPQKFERTAIRRPNDTSSLLTKAIMAESDDEDQDRQHPVPPPSQRRRSMVSNVSVASTTDLTSDTGLTSPSRTNTPSPPFPAMAVLRLGHEAEPKNISLGAAMQPHGKPLDAPEPQEAPKEPKEPPRKRCIQFACAAKPIAQPEAPRPAPVVKAPSALEAPRRSCIKFACPARPASTQNTPPNKTLKSAARSPALSKIESPSTPKKSSALGKVSTPPRPSPDRRSSNKTSGSRPKYVSANSTDLSTDASQFHEFASEMSREEDWIRENAQPVMTRLTINDTLTKENRIRRLATEAEEEAEAEDEDEEDAIDDEDDDEDVDDEGDDDDEDEDDEDEDEDEDGDSDGYHTDEETGFAESEDDDDEDENMMMWTPGRAMAVPQSAEVPVVRRPSLREQHSDSSTATRSSTNSAHRVKARRMKALPNEPDLPDSTDFVCGTLDEDRPLEEAYLNRMAARRNEKLRVIPQDIDPSFPASDPDNDEEEEIFNPVHRGSDEEVWMQGKMEDLHHDQDRSRRRRKSEQLSPRKYHSPPPKRHLSPAPKRHVSPPPKRHHSPAPKARARSPKPLFERNSPRRMKSPPRKAMPTPTATPRQGGEVQFDLAGRPGLTQTKSLPRAGALFHIKHARNKHHPRQDDTHVRGAVDIVKGLEKKRQRRKEKFHQKYCDRARRGQIPERKPQPGRGAERMKELGLLMAGKKDQGNYVLSV